MRIYIYGSNTLCELYTAKKLAIHNYWTLAIKTGPMARISTIDQPSAALGLTPLQTSMPGTSV